MESDSGLGTTSGEDAANNGEKHPDMAASYDNIGAVYEAKGDNDKALEYYNKSLAIRLNTLGENHADVATSYKSIEKE